jgi:glycosyltransferase involved in cell wall biosynthesis
MVPFRPKYSAFEEKNTKYDIVFFARVTKDKGIEDLIEALPAVKKKLQV